jgi:polysaccharide chain length determinant protein (PEP-CTERM system associated)
MQMYPEQIAKALVNESFHSRRLVVGVFVFVNAVILVTGLLWPKGYTASTSIFVDEKNIIQPLMQGAAVATEVGDRGRNAREVIFGRKIMDRILEHGGWLNKDRALTPEEQERIIEGIKKRTTISTVGRSIIKIEYRDDDPERSFRTTQKFAELFIQESIAAKAAESRAAFDFIEQQAQEYYEKLAKAELELKRLRSSNLDTRAGTDAELSVRLKELQLLISRTTQELREAEIKRVSLQQQASGEAEATANFMREGQYRARLNDLQSKLDTLLLSYRDTHPDVIHIKYQIQMLNERLTAEREARDTKRPGRVQADEAVVNNPVYQQLRRELSQNEATIEALKARIAEAQRELQHEVGRGKALHSSDARIAELTRDYQGNRDIYQDLMRRRENARVSMNLDAERQGLTLKIQEPAVLPVGPSGLRFLHFVVAGLLLGILIPLALIYARMELDPRIRAGHAISKTHKVPILVVVPHLWAPAELKGLRREFQMLALAVGASLALSLILSVLRAVKVL